MGRTYCFNCGRVGCDNDCEPVVLDAPCKGCGGEVWEQYEGPRKYFECMDCGKVDL